MIQPLQPWKDIDAVDLEKQIMKLRADGGTDISAAVRKASSMFTTKETDKYIPLLSLSFSFYFLFPLHII